MLMLIQDCIAITLKPELIAIIPYGFVTVFDDDFVFETFICLKRSFVGNATISISQLRFIESLLSSTFLVNNSFVAFVDYEPVVTILNGMIHEVMDRLTFISKVCFVFIPFADTAEILIIIYSKASAFNNIISVCDLC